MKLSGAIFDLDGTLLDSMGTWTNLSKDYIRAYGKEPRDEFFETLRPLTIRKAVELLIAEYDIPQSIDEIIDAFMEQVGYYFDNVFELKPGVREFVTELRNRDIPCCVATAADRIHSENALTRLGMIDAFEFILTTTDVGKSKRFPDVYLQSAARLGTPVGESFVFEDSYYAMVTAKKAGFPVAAVYEAEAVGDLDAIHEVSDVFLESFTEAGDVFFR